MRQEDLHTNGFIKVRVLIARHHKIGATQPTENRFPERKLRINGHFPHRNFVFSFSPATRSSPLRESENGAALYRAVIGHN